MGTTHRPTEGPPSAMHMQPGADVLDASMRVLRDTHWRSCHSSAPSTEAHPQRQKRRVVGRERAAGLACEREQQACWWSLVLCPTDGRAGIAGESQQTGNAAWKLVRAWRLLRIALLPS